MTSKKKITTNRKNAKNSSGPKTKRGKKHSSRNAFRHGFFAKELILSEAEKLELQSLGWALHTELLPTTALQHTAVERIVHCIGRVKLATGLEMRRAGSLLDAPNSQEEAAPEPPKGASETLKWCLAGRQELRDAIRFLEFVKGDFENSGRVREDHKEPLDRAFGPEFYDQLTKWMPMSHDAILLTQHLVRHAETFGKPLPPLNGDQPAKIVIDPAQGHQMVGKLLELKLQDLRVLSTSWEQRMSQAVDAHTATVDFDPRFFTAACRDLERAVKWFLFLKERKL